MCKMIEFYCRHMIFILGSAWTFKEPLHEHSKNPYATYYSTDIPLISNFVWILICVLLVS